MGQTFSWLHISDLHWGGSEHRDHWDTIHTALLADIKILQGKINGPIDAVLFTGDMVFNGIQQEFQEAGGWLKQLQEDLQKIGSRPVFLSVPGNHDLDRPSKDDDGFLLLSNNSSDAALKKVFNEEKSSAPWKTVNNSFRQYGQWLDQTIALWNQDNPLVHKYQEGLLPGEFCATLLKGGLKIGIIGLNSAFLHMAGGDYRGKLTLRTSQLTSLLGTNKTAWFQKHHFCFLMTHHPPEWLDDNGKMALGSDIAPSGRYLFHLCGHQHETFYLTWANGGSTDLDRQFVAPSLYGTEKYTVAWKDGKTQKKDDRRHGYCLGFADCNVQQATVSLFPRKAVMKGGKTWAFVLDTDQYLDENGATAPFQINLKINNLEPVSPLEPRTILPTPPRSIQQIVKESIQKTLEKGGMAELRLLLTDKIQDELPTIYSRDEDPAEVLVKADFLDSFRVLEKAIEAWLKDLRLRQSDISRFRDYGASIMGWLVLLSVKDKWLSDYIGSSKDDREIYLEIPVDTRVGVEIIVSRINLSAAELRIDHNSDGILTSKKGISCANLQERGWDDDANIFEVKKLLYLKLGYMCEGDVLPKNIDNRINKRLKYRREKREEDFLLVDVSKLDFDHQALKILRKDLPALRQVFLCGCGSARAFIVDEDDITVRLEEFFLTIFDL